VVAAALAFASSQISPVAPSQRRERESETPGDPVLNAVLYEPEIPPNTGNIIRLCANSGIRLHLVGPLGFRLDDSQLKRAGLDYHEMANVSLYENWLTYREQNRGQRLWAFSTHGQRRYCDVRYRANDALLFGPESRGLPRPLLEEIGSERVLRLPMVKQSRSLNLSNAVAIAVYEALRQLGFQKLF